MSEVLYEKRDAIAIVTLNRPSVLNALSKALCEKLMDAWREVNADKSIRAVVVTGAGGNFTTGGDLKEMQALASGDAALGGLIEKLSHMNGALLRDYAVEAPLIAAIEGFALAGGCELLQATDIRIAGQSAKFGLPEVKNGIAPLAGSTVRLVRQIPYAKAAEMLLTGGTIDAAEAKAFGLIGTIVPDGQALACALEMAEKIARNAPLAVSAALRSMRAAAGLYDAEALAEEWAIGKHVFDSADAREGLRAFVERRAPNFTGE